VYPSFVGHVESIAVSGGRSALRRATLPGAGNGAGWDIEQKKRVSEKEEGASPNDKNVCWGFPHLDIQQPRLAGSMFVGAARFVDGVVE